MSGGEQCTACGHDLDIYNMGVHYVGRCRVCRQCFNRAKYGQQPVNYPWWLWAMASVAVALFVTGVAIICVDGIN